MAGRDFQILEYDTLESTNDEARRLAEEGGRDGLVIRADQQTAGRGRRGREWVSDAGNLFASIVLRPEVPIAQIATLPFVAAVALGDMLVPKLDPAMGPHYKWPNDVLINDRKVAGILLESGGSRTGLWVVLGLGINLASHPDEAMFPATSLKESGVDWTPNAALDNFLRIFAGLYPVWQAHGFSPIRRSWLQRARHLGETIEVARHGERLKGIFEDVDESGALKLRLEDGTMETITAGDVFFADG